MQREIFDYQIQNYAAFLVVVFFSVAFFSVAFFGVVEAFVAVFLAEV